MDISGEYKQGNVWSGLAPIFSLPPIDCVMERGCRTDLMFPVEQYMGQTDFYTAITITALPIIIR